MNVFDLDAEVKFGEDDGPDPEAAQKSANTQKEDQDEDPDTSPEEKARIWKLLGMDPNA